MTLIETSRDHALTRLCRLQGLCHALRKEAWKFLLGYYPWESTHEERKTLQREKTYTHTHTHLITLTGVYIMLT